jgi:hypothetical protein
MKTNDGGPAFPIFTEDGECHMGLTKRDWFAGMVIQGWFAGDEGLRTATHLPSYADSAEYDWEHIARQAFKLADAILKVREQ